MAKLGHLIYGITLLFTCLQYVVTGSNVTYHTMFYVKITNYTGPPSRYIQPDTVRVACCRSVPLVNCTHFCETVFSVCADQCNTTVNITYTNRNNYIGENYGVLALNQRFVAGKHLFMNVYERRTDVRTGYQSTVTLHRIGTTTGSVHQSLWHNGVEIIHWNTSNITISHVMLLFCESNWFSPWHGCNETKPVDQLHMLTPDGHSSPLACNYKGKETSMIKILTNEPYKYTRDIVMTQIATFVADKICSSATRSMTQDIVDVHYDKPILRVVFWSECNISRPWLTDNEYLEFSDLKVFQALLYMTPLEERKYFTDPLKRIDLSDERAQGHFKILLRLKEYINTNRTYFTKENATSSYRAHRCPDHGCTPAFKIRYDNTDRFIFDNNLFGDKLTDCFGHLVNPENTTSTTTVLNTILLNTASNWTNDGHFYIDIYHENNTEQPIALLDVGLNNITTIGSSFQRARPSILTRKASSGVSVQFEVLVWCSNGRTGDSCQLTCGSDQRTDCNVEMCVPKASHILGIPDVFHCHHGECVNGTCICNNGISGILCSIDTSAYAHPGALPKTEHIDNIVGNTTECVRGYIGYNCDRVDYCVNNPCKHGTCTNTGDWYTCDCSDEYRGYNCDLNYCCAKSCLNEGQYSNGVCICKAGYNGSRCENDIDDCEIVICENNGTCIDGVNNYTCKCADGFSGSHCSINIDDCHISICGNNGTCIDGVNNYTCICAEGFEGSHCRININDCLGHSCENNGRCIDGVNNYSCICAEGFGGWNCSIDFSDCRTNPYENCSIPGTEMRNNNCVHGFCLNGATCVDQVGSFHCHCVDGFGGKYCQNNIDDCEPKPCQKRGSCEDRVNGYMCYCREGVEGTECQTVVSKSTTIIVSMSSAASFLLIVTVAVICCYRRYKRIQAIQKKSNSNTQVTEQSDGVDNKYGGGYTNIYSTISDSLTNYSTVKHDDDRKGNNVIEGQYIELNNQKSSEHVYLHLDKNQQGTVKYYNECTRTNHMGRSKEQKPGGLNPRDDQESRQPQNAKIGPRGPKNVDDNKPTISTHRMNGDRTPYINTNTNSDPADLDDYDDIEPSTTTSTGLGSDAGIEVYDDIEPSEATTAGVSSDANNEVYGATIDITERRESYLKPKGLSNVYTAGFSSGAGSEVYDDIEPNKATTDGVSSDANIEVYDATIDITERRDTYLKPTGLLNVYDYAL